MGIDIGGTRIKAGLVSASGDVVDSRVVDTPRRADHIVQAVASLVGRYQSEHMVSQVGVAVAAFLNAGRDRIELSPNIDWQDRPLRDELSERIGCPVVLENDPRSGSTPRPRGQRQPDAWPWPGPLSPAQEIQCVPLLSLPDGLQIAELPNTRSAQLTAKAGVLYPTEGQFGV